jgi:prepilin-type processing-associated H-X9-DG protein
MKSYVGLNGASSPQDTLFACPADAFDYHCMLPLPPIQGSEVTAPAIALQLFKLCIQCGEHPQTTTPLRIVFPAWQGRKLTSIQKPDQNSSRYEEGPATHAIFLASTDAIAFGLAMAGVNDSKNMVSFVDGHVSYIKIYWDSITAPGHFEAWHYDPPAEYDYQWSGD